MTLILILFDFAAPLPPPPLNRLNGFLIRREKEVIDFAENRNTDSILHIVGITKRRPEPLLISLSFGAKKSFLKLWGHPNELQLRNFLIALIFLILFLYMSKEADVGEAWGIINRYI